MFEILREKIKTLKLFTLMLSKNLHQAINAQINAELWSAYLYLAMSMDAEAKGLKGVANWFHVQYLEEQDHARIFMNYLNSRDAKVVLQPIAEVPTAWNSVLEMFEQTLAHEKKVTALINNLALRTSRRSGSDHCREYRCGVPADRSRWIRCHRLQRPLPC